MLSAAENELLTRTGKGTTAGDYLRRFWMPALLTEEIPAPDCPPVRVRLMGECLIAFRDSSGRAALVGQYCMHRQMDLFFGRNEEGGIRCAYHGWKFDADGNCVDLPTEPKGSKYKDNVHLTSYPCQEFAGIVWAYLGPKDADAQIPQFEFNSLPPENMYLRKSLLSCNYLQAMEGNLDSSHTGYLHSFSSGSALDPRGQGHGKRGGVTHQYQASLPSFEVKDTDYGCMIGAKRKSASGPAYWRVTQWLLPVHTLIAANVGETLLWDAWVPMDDEHTWVYRIEYNPWRALTKQELFEYNNVGFARLNVENIPGTYLPVRNKENDYLIDRELQRTYSYTGIKGTNAQDAAAIENQGPTPIADRTKENLSSSDLAIIRMRRKFLNVLQDFKDGVEPAPALNGDMYKVRAIAMSLEDDGVPFYEGAKELLFL